ncbi:uncharacterized protein PHACADRAFT_250323 [Phanerochaete carnosa HHB-10118-sp]|uniref:Uncharacterized protein n=1 Tax=Phanerochaete carnosa (strain HHB-10118-sp) TaxID=650164 RepID=K5V9Y6_PHACS|nr:uncharacterized protein PHACADRAFT_250323 [Phanerochaete carnosa HHB-10118-sp]EKM59676.1 hypothetical protein PHACADRAFT_250323 [Phanerochaete carnosa HHB-10118-sp]
MFKKLFTYVAVQAIRSIPSGDSNKTWSVRRAALAASANLSSYEYLPSRNWSTIASLLPVLSRL